ncbi:MAG: hypothetical protein Q8Q38_02970 [bacterium]|nr:hypothetical protein [bacterium]MDZ4232062.1 hypothetical protein [Candidatus Pacearchaeota archaeon]
MASITIHPHAKIRMQERGATKREVTAAVREGEQFRAKFGRVGFRMNFPARGNRMYQTKQVEAYGVKEDKALVIITVIVKYF